MLIPVRVVSLKRQYACTGAQRTSRDFRRRRRPLGRGKKSGGKENKNIVAREQSLNGKKAVGQVLMGLGDLNSI